MYFEFVYNLKIKKKQKIERNKIIYRFHYELPNSCHTLGHYWWFRIPLHQKTKGEKQGYFIGQSCPRRAWKW